MEQKFVVDTTLPEMRVALIENGVLTELFVASEEGAGVGNFYRGRVTHIMAGLQSAFVDVGLKRDGFISWGDMLLTDEQRKKKQFRIEEVLSEGDKVLVQMSKEASGGKGCRLTTKYSVPGRFLVLLPGTSRTMVSKKITHDKARKRLKTIVQKLKDSGSGVIIRTVAETATKKELEQDMRYVMRIWRRARSRYKRGSGAKLLHEELGVVQRVLRDKWTKDCVEILVDNDRIRNRVLDALSLMAPRTSLRKMVKKYNGKRPVFETYGLDEELQTALRKRVQLESGGYLLFEEAESLTAIDVNSGRLTEGQSMDEIAMTTNLEAAAEISRQIRLRNIGGIIVVDFINLSSKTKYDKILRDFKRHCRSDREVTDIYDFSELGILQMCRQRTRESLHKVLTEECPHCKGIGRVLKYKRLKP